MAGSALPVRDVIITNSAGMVILRRSYGSLPPEQVETTASIVNLITPLMEQIGKTDVGKVMLGSQYLTFKRTKDLLFIVFSDKDVKMEIAEAICEEISKKFPPTYEKEHEEVRKFKKEIDTTVLSYIGQKEFIPCFFSGTLGVEFIAYRDIDGEWSVRAQANEAEVRGTCEKLHKELAQSKSLRRNAILRIESKIAPILVAMVGNGLLFLGINEEEADLDILFDRIRELREIISLSRPRITLHVPAEMRDLYERTLSLYLLLYEDGESVLRRDLSHLMRRGMGFGEALKKLFEKAESQI